MKVTKIEKKQKTTTFDISVLDNHNYFVGNSQILVHNSGKDATKVDRSAAYMARRIAVDLLKSHKAKEVMVQLSYAIGYNQPLQSTAIIDGTEFDISTLSEFQYDLSPNGIINFLNLKTPIYSDTAMWGHMGNQFEWK